VWAQGAVEMLRLAALAKQSKVVSIVIGNEENLHPISGGNSSNRQLEGQDVGLVQSSDDGHGIGVGSSNKHTAMGSGRASYSETDTEIGFIEVNGRGTMPHVVLGAIEQYVSSSEHDVRDPG